MKTEITATINKINELGYMQEELISFPSSKESLIEDLKQAALRLRFDGAYVKLDWDKDIQGAGVFLDCEDTDLRMPSFNQFPDWLEDPTKYRAYHMSIEECHQLAQEYAEYDKDQEGRLQEYWSDIPLIIK